jgi:hypothetical protein
MSIMPKGVKLKFPVLAAIAILSGVLLMKAQAFSVEAQNVSSSGIATFMAVFADRGEGNYISVNITAERKITP